MKGHLLGLILISLSFSISAQNLILNGSCDSALVGGNIPNWQEITGTDWGQRTANPAPFKGVGYFFPSSTATDQLRQVVDLTPYASAIDSGVLKLRFIGYVLSYVQSPADESNVEIRLSDGTNTLNTYLVGPYNQTVAWLKIDTMLAVAPTVRSATISLKSTRKNGTNNDGYYDELSLLPVIDCFEKTFSVTPDTASICTGTQIQLCGPTGYKKYTWNTSDTGACLQASGIGSYRLAALDVNDCPISSNTVNIAQKVLPPVELTVATDTICSGDSSQICAPAGYASYQWNANNGSAQCVQAKNTGSYYLTVVDNEGCTIESVREGLTVRPVPSVSIIVSGDTLTSFGAASYQWYRNDTLIQGATAEMYIATVTGDYNLRVTDANGCEAYFVPVSIDIATSVSVSFENNLKVYPNPTTGSILLSVAEAWIGSRLEIYNVEGRLISRSELRNTQTQLTLPYAGVYFLFVHSPLGSVTHKLVKL